jgi:hypothetical protein
MCFVTASRLEASRSAIVCDQQDFGVPLIDSGSFMLSILLGLSTCSTGEHSGNRSVSARPEG